MEQETKTCACCKRELPLTNFHKNRMSVDGLQTICKECRSQKYYHKGKTEMEAKKDNPLCNYTPKELLAELKRRGYKWEKMYVLQEILYEKI